LAAAGMGGIYPGVLELLATSGRDGRTAALGAEASRDYLLSVSDQQGLDGPFAMAFCTGEFGAGGAYEMIEEIMTQAEVSPNETVVLGTRADYFRAARNLGVLSIGCGWGLHGSQSLTEADAQASMPEQVVPAIGMLDARICGEER
jgi:phosphoglycolate phosphatase-like HAD superfamily hydrolase